uniref:Uncharacterized protein n=1 Tax=Arundo donax TaxID=35708 RepID=A0A0A8Y602_ARUDO
MSLPFQVMSRGVIVEYNMQSNQSNKMHF